MKKELYLFVLVTLFSFLGCATGNNSVSKKPSIRSIGEVSPSSLKIIAPENNKRVFIFKYDGSAQCNRGSVVSLQKMSQELNRIKIYSQIKKSDGLMHIQVCGAPTGMANVFEIAKKDFNKSIKLGFKLWNF